MTSLKEYEEIWTNHVQDLSRLVWYLNNEQQKELFTMQKRLFELVKEAKTEKLKHLCPCCGKELIQLQYLGNPDLLPDKDETMCTWTDLEGFYPFEKGTRWKN